LRREGKIKLRLQRRPPRLLSLAPPSTADRLELDRIAKENDWSESYAVRVAIQEFVENKTEQRVGSRIDTIVTSAIDRNFQKREDREARLLAKIFYSMEFFRLLFIRFFKLFVGNDKMVDDLVKDLGEEARDNIK
jgi:hypothetical protein